MAKEKKESKGDSKCPNCNDTGKFIDECEEITCPCQSLKE